MADKNFIVKNGLTVGGAEIVNSSGALTQSLITSVPSGAAATTQSVGNSSTALATTAYVRGEIDALIDSAPGTLNTLDELAAAINDDAQFNTTLTNAVALKAPLASPTFTGTITGTLATAAQTNITSLGTLTSLTVDGGGSRQYINSGHVRLSDDYNLEWGGGTNYIRGSNSSGNMSIVVTGDINLDADGGDIVFKDGGSSIGRFKNNSGNFVIKSEGSDDDLKFLGNDGGSEITALTLDMSDAGTAIFNAGASFNDNVNLADDDKLILGTHDDLHLYHSGGNSYIKNDTSQLYVLADYFNVKNNANSKFAIRTFPSDAVKLYFNNGEKLVTSNTGVTVTGTVNAGTTSSVGIGATIADVNTSELGPGYLSLGRDDTADAAQILFSKNGAVHSYLETRTNGLGFITNVGDFGFEGGDVGIGTASPAQLLHLKETGSTSAVNEFLRLENSAGGGAAAGSSINFHHYHAGGGPAGGAKAASITAQNMDSWSSGTPSGYSTGLTFGTLHANTFAERMRIASNGAVGINRTASQSNTKLEVGGADNVPLIAAEASGVFAGLGTVSAVSGTGLYVGTTLKFAVASTGAIGINGANYGTDGQVFTSGGAGAAAGWEDAGGLPSGMTFSDGRNLGIGVTPESGWANDDNAIQIGGLGGLWGKTSAAAAKHTTLSNNVYDHPSTGQAAIVTDEGAKITLTNGTIQLTTTSAATTADAAHSWNTGLNLNSSGTLGINVTGTGGSGIFSTSKLHIKTTHGVPANSGTTQGNSALCLEPQPNIRFDIGSNYYWSSGIWMQTGNTTDLSAKYAIHLNPKGGASSANGGDVGIANQGATPTSSNPGFMFKTDQFYTATTSTSANTQIRLINGNGLVGSISTSGSATAFNTSSDYRLKENVDYTWDATTRLKQLKPARFNWIVDDTNTLVDGFLAHEVSSIVPDAITGEKDGMSEPVLWKEEDNIPDGKSVGDVRTASEPEYQHMDHSKLVPLLVKTIQELEARIATLEG